MELTGSFTATVNVELRVGGVAETITVTGQSPIVDVQGTNQQATLSAETLARAADRTQRGVGGDSHPWHPVPGGRPGASNPMDVGGVGALSNIYLTIHGSNYLDQRMSVDGTQVRNILGAGNANNFAPDMASTQEVIIDIAAGSVDQFTGGVRMNFIPKEGGNAFRGILLCDRREPFVSGEQHHAGSAGSRARGPNALSKQYDFNPTVGGPILRDRLWFYTGVRWQSNENYLAGMYENLNAGNADAWTLRPGLQQTSLVQHYRRRRQHPPHAPGLQPEQSQSLLSRPRPLLAAGRPNFSPDAFSHTSSRTSTWPWAAGLPR